MIRIGVGLLVAAQSMIFGLAINLEDQTPRLVKLGVQGSILAGTLLVIALLGWPLIRSALAELRRGRLTIEALFLLTLTGAMFASLQSFISGNGPIYFEVVSILLVVYSIGKMIGARSREAALASTRAWSSALNQCRRADGTLVDLAAISPGDQVEVRAGETISIDGVIKSGIGFVAEAPINGEPFAVVKRTGDCVFAGSISQDAVFQIDATSAGNARQVDWLLEAVEAARNRPTALQAQADRLARIFLPVVVSVAAITFAVWTHRADWQTGLFNAMAVLLVACPCALGLATPIVLWSTLNRLSERGLVVHSGDVIERLAQVDQVVFDKTGTLTEDQFRIVDIATIAEKDERVRLLSLLSLVEAQTNHPVARPFAALPQHFALDSKPRVIEHRTIPGCGIEAKIDDRGANRHMRVGRAGWLSSSDSSDARELLRRLHTRDGHRIDFEIDGKLAGIAIVSERMRDSAHETIIALRKMGLPVAILTGDSAQNAIALGLANVEGHLLPDDKKERIARAGKPLMIGDGINDSSALAAAHVGIALASGSDLANHAAGATLHHGGLQTIPWAIELSRQAMRTVRCNLWRAVAYNLIGISLAAFGVLHPIAAALLMAVSSLWVAWSSVRGGAAKPNCSHAFQEDSDAEVTTRPGLHAGGNSAAIRALIHAFAFACQALCVGLLLRFSPTTLVLLTFFLLALGGIASYAWLRSNHVPSWLDMTFGMLTLGNLGMLLGWWADNGFARLNDAQCFACVEALRAGHFRPWMLIGMLVGANLAMLFFSRRSANEAGGCQTAMFTGGNVGMILGMLAGGVAANGIATDSVMHAFVLSFAGMTAGMIAGMLLGTLAARMLIGYWSQASQDHLVASGTR
jgi:P-type Cu+ transporter